jgi:hypothetical protein
MVFVPDVAANVYVWVPAVLVIPDVDALKLPYMVIAVFVTLPANPVGFVPSVKSKSRTEPAVTTIEPLPLITLNEMLLASVTTVGVMVRAVALLLVRIISGVPLTVIVVTPVKIVPVLFSEMVFVPKASVPVKPVQVRV